MYRRAGASQTDPMCQAGQLWGPPARPVFGALNMHLVKNRCKGSRRFKSGERTTMQTDRTRASRSPCGVAGRCMDAVARGDRSSTPQMLCGLLA